MDVEFESADVKVEPPLADVESDVVPAPADEELGTDADVEVESVDVDVEPPPAVESDVAVSPAPVDVEVECVDVDVEPPPAVESDVAVSPSTSGC